MVWVSPSVHPIFPFPFPFLVGQSGPLPIGSVCADVSEKCTRLLVRSFCDSVLLDPVSG
jgi:hypothetical protein